MHDNFNVMDVRPWLHLDRFLDVSYPPDAPHPALNPFVQASRGTIGCFLHANRESILTAD
jgi:hypothetical protein